MSKIELMSEFSETVLGLSWDNPTEEEITKRLGPGTLMELLFDTDERIPEWTFPLDDGAKTELRIWLGTKKGKGQLVVDLQVASGSELEKYDRVTTGLFIAWAATKKLLDEAALAKHADVLRAVQQRKAQGTALFDALGRGLWDTHLEDKDGLRTFAYKWFHNIRGPWITADLNALFGKRRGLHGHDEPVLDDDTWEAVDKASKVFSERFARWI